jgi:hypothetical protein
MALAADVMVEAYTLTLDGLWNEAEKCAERMAQGDEIEDGVASGFFDRYLIIRLKLIRQQFPDLVVLPWTPPTSCVFRRAEDVRRVQQDIDHVRMALRFLRSH